MFLLSTSFSLAATWVWRRPRTVHQAATVHEVRRTGKDGRCRVARVTVDVRWTHAFRLAVPSALNAYPGSLSLPFCLENNKHPLSVLLSSNTRVFLVLRTHGARSRLLQLTCDCYVSPLLCNEGTDIQVCKRGNNFGPSPTCNLQSHLKTPLKLCSNNRLTRLGCSVFCVMACFTLYLRTTTHAQA